jgi:hypothetical protein
MSAFRAPVLNEKFCAAYGGCYSTERTAKLKQFADLLESGEWGVHTLAFYLPQRQTGGVIFTNGENGAKVIRDVVRLLYPDPNFMATL